MLIIDLPSYNIHWQFTWIYRTFPAKEVDKFNTITYLRWKTRGTAGRGAIVASHFKEGNYSKDNERIATLYQGLLETIFNLDEFKCVQDTDKCAIFDAIMGKYAAQSRVPSPRTKLEEYQLWLLEFLNRKH